MSLYHFHVTQIKRSKGYSAVAAAAYRAGGKLYSDYYGETFDYTKKQGVLLSEIILPEHVPAEYKDRQLLWDSVEKIEKHPKAQLAYSFDIALQNELSMEENIALARRFIFENLTSRGMIADWALHAPKPKEGKEPNPHFHILCPMRFMDENGKWGAKQKREYILDKNGERIRDERGRYIFNAVATTDWGKPETLEQWRHNWADLVNEKFREKGLERFCINSGSYEEAGIERIPQIHEGAAVQRIEEKGFKTDKGIRNRWIISINNVLRDLAGKIKGLIEWITKVRETIADFKNDEALTVGMLVGEYLEHRNEVAEGYARGVQKAKGKNLKLVSSLYVYVQEKNIVTLEDLEKVVRDLDERARLPRKLFNQRKDKISFIKKQIRDAKAVIDNKPVYEESRKIWFPAAKKKFRKEHEKELKQYHAALRSFGDTGFVPDKDFIKKCRERLKEEERGLEQIRADSSDLREEYEILQEIRKAIDTAINDRKKQGNPAEILKGIEGGTEKSGNDVHAKKPSVMAKMRSIKEEIEREKRDIEQKPEEKRNLKNRD